METRIQPNQVGEIGTLHASDIFGEIYLKNGWLGSESVSGPRSDVGRCESVISALPKLFADLRVTSMLDIPCGDLNWMRKVELGAVKYIGADIVPELIRDDLKRYGWLGMKFKMLDIMQDQLPKCDLILCRDCLVHFSFADISKAVSNIINSGAKYLLCTTFSNADRENKDVTTGYWRPLNMENAPFRFPAPLQTIKETAVGNYSDKGMGLWKVGELK